MNYVFRCYVEKKPGFNLEARRLFLFIRTGLGITSLRNLRIFERYDVDNVDFPVYLSAKSAVFAHPAQEDLYEENLPPQDPDTLLLAVEPLPGAPDERTGECIRSIGLLARGGQPLAACARVYALTGLLSGEELEKIRELLIPAHCREGSLDKPAALTPPAHEETPRAPIPPLCTLSVPVLVDGEAAEWRLIFHREPCPDSYQSFRLLCTPSPSAPSPVHGSGRIEAHFHPSFESTPLSAGVFVSMGEGSGDVPAAIPYESFPIPAAEGFPHAVSGSTTIEKVESILHDPGLASQQGLTEALALEEGAVLVPFGGKNQKTPVQVSAVLLPAADSGVCSVLACGFHPGLSGETAQCASALEGAAKLVAAGCHPGAIHFLPQSSPTAPLFAAAAADASLICSPEFKSIRRPVYLFQAPPHPEGAKEVWTQFHRLLEEGSISSAWAVGRGGIMEGLMKMAFGGDIGFVLDSSAGDIDLFAPLFGSIVAECTAPIDCPAARLLGKTAYTPLLELSDCFLPLNDLRDIWEGTLEDEYPTRADTGWKDSDMADIFCAQRSPLVAKASFAQPRAVIPVLPGGSGGEYTAAACARAGIFPELFPMEELTPTHLDSTARSLAAAIGQAQILILPGGLSSDSVPDSAGRLMSLFLRTPILSDVISELLKQRDGLILGIGSGFHTLVYLGLLPFGELRPVGGVAPSFTGNLIGRHQSRYVTTRVASLKSPWMLECELDQLHTLPLSHSAGRLTIPANLLSDLIAAGQIATQYVDTAGIPSVDISVNPTGAVESIEGLFSPDGRVFGKLAHPALSNGLTARNIPGFHHQPILEGGARYFK